MANLALSHVCKRFGDTTAVDDFCLEAEPGEFIVLVGPSGCGKTTTMRMIAGLEDVTEGTIALAGRDITELAAKDRDISMVFQNYALYPHLTVFDNVGFPLRMRRMGRSAREQKVREVADLLGIGHLLGRKPKELSGGQRQRVALGRAIVREPALFLMDEPLSNLDAKLRVDMRAEIVKLQRSLGITTVYVTHDQIEAMTMGHRIVIMNEGVIQQVGTPEQIYTEPANRFVAQFIGTPPMNFGSARCAEDAGDGAAVMIWDSRVRLDEPRTGALAYLDRAEPIELGFRPEHVHLGEAERFADAPGIDVRGRIELIENIGNSKIVEVVISSGDSLNAICESDFRGAVGDETQVHVAARHLHVFNQHHHRVC